MILSQKRADAVVRYLTNKGINSSRLIGQGYGQARPVESNDTKEGRALNRRTEIYIIYLKGSAQLLLMIGIK